MEVLLARLIAEASSRQSRVHGTLRKVAIGLYLADRHAYGRLAPKVDDPARGTYLRWALFAPSVIEPGAMAKLSGWSFKESQAGWGSHEAMLASVERW